MKKIASIIIISIILVTGCSSGKNNTVATDGSTSMERVIGFLSEAYMEENTDIKVTFNPTGSGAGIQAVLEDRCDIGLSSRDFKEGEGETLSKTVVAIDGIAIIVNPKNPVNDLTVEQIGKLYKGEINNWSKVGGNNAPVVLIGREAASGTREGFEEVTLTKDLCKYTQELTSTGDIVQTVASNSNAIGYVSLASVKDNVKVLMVEGIEPTMKTIQSGSYKIQRDFLFVTKKDKQMSEAVKDFFDYSTSKEVDNLIMRAGAIPIKR